MLISTISSTMGAINTVSSPVALSTLVSPASAVASSSDTASVITMTTHTGLPEYGVLAVIALIILLSAKEILSASDEWNRTINCSLNMSILPLLISFSAIVIFSVDKILH